MGTSEVDLYRAQFEACAEQGRRLAEGVDDTRFNWRPAPDKWSIQECLTHLILTGKLELPAMEKGIGRGRERGLTGDGPFAYGPLERWFLRLTEPPVRVRAPAPRSLRPQREQPAAAVLPAFLDLQRQFSALAEAARGLDLRRVKVATPVSRVLRISLGIALAQAAAHQRRHLEQARRVAACQDGQAVKTLS